VPAACRPVNSRTPPATGNRTSVALTAASDVFESITSGRFVDSLSHCRNRASAVT